MGSPRPSRIAERLGVWGRIEADDWVGQARLLAAGARPRSRTASMTARCIDARAGKTGYGAARTEAADARQMRLVAVVIAATMVLWLGVQWIGADGLAREIRLSRRSCGDRGDDLVAVGDLADLAAAQRAVAGTRIRRC